jgi:hypothetical protein
MNRVPGRRDALAECCAADATLSARGSMVSWVPCTALFKTPTTAGADFSLPGDIDVAGTRTR